MEKIIKVNIIFIILFIVFSSFSNVFAADLQTSLKVIKEASETGYLENDQGYIEERIVSSDSENGELTVQLSVNNKEKDNSTEITKYENTEIFILVPENLTDEARTQYSSYIDTLATKIFEQNENTKIGIIGIQGPIQDNTIDEDGKLVDGENDESGVKGTAENAEIVANLTNKKEDLVNAFLLMNSSKTEYYSNLQAAIRLANNSYSNNVNKILVSLYDNVSSTAIGISNQAPSYGGIFSEYNTVEESVKAHLDSLVKNTKSEILALKNKNINFILLRPDNTSFDREYYSTQTGEFLLKIDGTPYVNELYGTLENPTYGKMYSLNNDRLEDIVTNYIYKDIIEEIRPSIENSKIKYYFSKEIFDNFEVTILNSDITNIDTINLQNDGHIEWDIGKLSGNQSSILEYKLKIKDMKNTQLLNKIINISEKTEFTYTNYLNEDKSKTITSSPQIQLVEIVNPVQPESNDKDDTIAPEKLPYTGLKITLICIIVAVIIGAVLALLKYSKLKDI